MTKPAGNTDEELDKILRLEKGRHGIEWKYGFNGKQLTEVKRALFSLIRSEKLELLERLLEETTTYDAGNWDDGSVLRDVYSAVPVSEIEKIKKEIEDE